MAFNKFNIKEIEYILDQDLFYAMKKSVKVYYDYNNQFSCFDILEHNIFPSQNAFLYDKFNKGFFFFDIIYLIY